MLWLAGLHLLREVQFPRSRVSPRHFREFQCWSSKFCSCCATCVLPNPFLGKSWWLNCNLCASQCRKTTGDEQSDSVWLHLLLCADIPIRASWVIIILCKTNLRCKNGTKLVGTHSLLFSLWSLLHIFIIDHSHHYFTTTSGPLVALGPIVAMGIRQHTSVSIESNCCHWQVIWLWWVCFARSLCVLVPDMHASVSSTSGQCAICGMEWNVVYNSCIFAIICSMAFEWKPQFATLIEILTFYPFPRHNLWILCLQHFPERIL